MCTKNFRKMKVIGNARCIFCFGKNGIEGEIIYFDIGATGTVFLGSLSVPDGSALDEIFGFAVYGKDILTQKCYDEAITGRES